MLPLIGRLMITEHQWLSTVMILNGWRFLLKLNMRNGSCLYDTKVLQWVE
jgi:hypothetical protein